MVIHQEKLWFISNIYYLCISGISISLKDIHVLNFASRYQFISLAEKNFVPGTLHCRENGRFGPLAECRRCTWRQPHPPNADKVPSLSYISINFEFCLVFTPMMPILLVYVTSGPKTSLVRKNDFLSKIRISSQQYPSSELRSSILASS